MFEAMQKAAEALSWKNPQLVKLFGIRLGVPDECTAPRTVLEQFFDQAKLCAMAPWLGWGIVIVTGIARADRAVSHPLHLVRAHPQGQYFDLAYTPAGSCWSLQFRAVPWDVAHRNILAHGIAGVIDDMRRSMNAFNIKFCGNGNNSAAVHAASAAPAAPPKRHEPGRQRKPNRVHAAHRH